jgi:hypothetical protein
MNGPIVNKGGVIEKTMNGEIVNKVSWMWWCVEWEQCG